MIELLKKQGNRGATFLEILIAMAIAVVAIGASSSMFVKTYKIAKIGCNESKLQRCASQIMDMMIFGEHGGTYGMIGMKSLTSFVANPPTSANPLEYEDRDGNAVQVYLTGTDIYRKIGVAAETNLDYSNEIDVTGLKFMFFGPDVDLNGLNPPYQEGIPAAGDEIDLSIVGNNAKVTEILIELSVQSTTGSITHTITLRSSVSPRNLPQELPQSVF